MIGLWRTDTWTLFRLEDTTSSPTWKYITCVIGTHILVFAPYRFRNWKALINGQVGIIDQTSFGDMTYIPCDGCKPHAGYRYYDPSYDLLNPNIPAVPGKRP